MVEALEDRTLLAAASDISGADPVIEGNDYATLLASMTSTGSHDEFYHIQAMQVDIANEYPVATPQSLPLINLDAFRADPRFAGIDGSGFSVAIIDTGADLDHSFFGADSDGNGVADRIVHQFDFSGTNDSDASATDGHGTHVASTALSSDSTIGGVAPGAGIIILKVFRNFSGSATEADLEEALQWAAANVATFNLAAVNMSLATSENFNTPQTTHANSDELAALAAADAIVASSSGNSFFGFGSRQGVALPSADPNSLSVGATWDADHGRASWSGGPIDFTTDADRIVSFSQRHETLTDIFAPGALIQGAWLNGGTNNIGGTSMASPHIAGAAALAQQLAVRELGRRLTLDEFRTLLDESGVTVNDGDDEDDNVKNTGLDFKRIDMLELGKAILRMAGDNDDFDIRIDLGSVASVTTPGSNVGFTGETGEPAQSDPIQSAWWSWTAPASGTLIIDTIGSNFDTFLTLATGSAVDALTVVAQDDNGGGGLQSLITASVTAGTQYQIAVDGLGEATGDITLNLDFTYPNDDFVNRIDLASARTLMTSGRIIGFTGETGEPAHNGTIHSAWWSWTAPASGKLIVDTNGSNFDTFLTLATGSAGDALNVLAQNDNGGSGLQSLITASVTAGTQYQIAVDGFAADTGEINLNLELRFPNDDFANRINLGSDRSVTTAGRNVGFTAGTGEPPQNGPIQSAWWSWTVPVSGKLTVDTNGSSFDTFLTLATGSSVDALTVLAQDDDNGSGLQSLITASVTAGTQYQIAVDGYAAVTGNITLNLFVTPNDDFANRVDLGSVRSVTTAGNNVGFAGETAEPPQSGKTHSAWWSWTAPFSGELIIDTIGSNFDTVLTLATGSSADALTVVAQDDNGGGGMQSLITASVTAGTPYQIAVDGFASNTGDITLNVSVMYPNDQFASRIDLGSVMSVTTAANNVGFAGETGEPAQSGTIRSAWWSWTAPASGNLIVDTNGSNFDTFLTLATGSAVDALTVLEQDDDGGGGSQSQIATKVTAGTQYQIAVDGFGSTTGDITLNLAFTFPNDDFANRIDLGSVSSVTTAGNNEAFTSEGGEPPQSFTIHSAWWSWTAPASGEFIVDTNGSNFSTFLTLATGSAVDALTVLDQNSSGSQSRITASVTAGTQYQIAVDGNFSFSMGDITLNLSFTPNDDFADRIDLASVSSVTATGTNVGFTGEFNELTQSGASHSAWWSWTAPLSGELLIDTNGSSFDTFLTLATGSSVDALTVVAQDDNGGDQLQSLITASVTAGTQYQIAVDGLAADTGDITLNLAFEFPNDDFADRVDLGSVSSVTTAGSNIGFTSEPGEPAQSFTIHSAWWSWTAPASGELIIDTIGSNFNTFLTLATGSSVDALTVLEQDDDGGSGSQSRIVTSVTAGTEYQIAVDGSGSFSTGDITLNLAFTFPNDDFANRIDLGSASSVTTPGNNVGFTGETGEPPQERTIHSAWWSWTAPASGELIVDTIGSNFDTFLTLATGSAVDALTVLGQNDDLSVDVLQSRITASVTAGTQYQIAVASATLLTALTAVPKMHLPADANLQRAPHLEPGVGAKCLE